MDLKVEISGVFSLNKNNIAILPSFFLLSLRFRLARLYLLHASQKKLKPLMSTFSNSYRF